MLYKLRNYAKLVIIDSNNTDNLPISAEQLEIVNKCNFTRVISDKNLDKFKTGFDCARFPSLD